MGHQNHHAVWAVHHKLGGCLTKPQSWVCKTAFYHQREAVYTSKGSSVYMIRSEQAEGHKLITWKSGQNAYGSHSATLLSLSLHLWPQLTTGNIPGLQIGLHNMQGSPKSGQLQQYSPFLGYPSRTVVKKNSPTGRNFNMCISFTLLAKTNGQSWWQGNLEKRHLCMVKYIPHGCSPKGDISR